MVTGARAALRLPAQRPPVTTRVCVHPTLTHTNHLLGAPENPACSGNCPGEGAEPRGALVWSLGSPGPAAPTPKPPPPNPTDDRRPPGRLQSRPRRHGPRDVLPTRVPPPGVTTPRFTFRVQKCILRAMSTALPSRENWNCRHRREVPGRVNTATAAQSPRVLATACSERRACRPLSAQSMEPNVLGRRSRRPHPGKAPPWAHSEGSQGMRRGS